MLHSITYRRGQDDVGILNLKEVINLSVASQLLAAQPQRAKLLLPILKALTAEGFHWGHYREQKIYMQQKNASLNKFKCQHAGNDIQEQVERKFYNYSQVCCIKAIAYPDNT